MVVNVERQVVVERVMWKLKLKMKKGQTQEGGDAALLPRSRPPHFGQGPPYLELPVVRLQSDRRSPELEDLAETSSGDPILPPERDA